MSVRPLLLREEVARSGHDGPGREQVTEIQRARILAGMVEVATGRGLANSTVAHVVSRCGVSRRTFYEIFEDREDCFLGALDDAVARAGEYVIGEYETAGRWRERIRGGLAGFLSFLDDEPAMGRLLVVESLAAGPKAMERRRRVLDRLISAVDEGRGEPGARREIPALTGEGVVGAVSSVLHARLTEREHGPLIELTGPLMSIVVLPYLGPAAAQSELARPAPKPHSRARVAGTDLLRDLEMRLTYRTVRVLTAIGAQPGASNNEVGVAAGVEDQGQMSKLLARLARLGLIENTGAGHMRGAPNAWTLTDSGRKVENAILH
jgi:AcrR family transcriptional regulator/DNA-binding MarR family transcriptional regulator